MLLKRLSRDLDFALPSNGISFARRVANALKADFMVLDDERDTGRVIVTESDGTRTFLDFATYRGTPLWMKICVPATSRSTPLHMTCAPAQLLTHSMAHQICAQKRSAPVCRRLLPMTRFASCAPYDKPRHLISRSNEKRGNQCSKARIYCQTFRLNESVTNYSRSLKGPKPAASMRALEMLGVFPHLLPELSALKGVEQSVASHLRCVGTYAQRSGIS